MDRRTKVELLEAIRREYAHGTGTIQGAASKPGVFIGGWCGSQNRSTRVRLSLKARSRGHWPEIRAAKSYTVRVTVLFSR